MHPAARARLVTFVRFMTVKLPLEDGHAEHLSVYQTSPELWEREAFEEKLDGAPEATGEPGKSSAGELGRPAVRVFFSVLPRFRYCWRIPIKQLWPSMLGTSSVLLLPNRRHRAIRSS